MTSIVKPAQKLAAVWGPTNPEYGGVGNRAGKGNVECILVAQLEGPMGFYDVARVIFDNGTPDRLYPLHMMEQIDFAE